MRNNKDRQNKRNRPITKLALYLRAMRMSLWIIAPFFVLIILLALSGDANIAPGLGNMIQFVIGTTLGFYVILLFILTPLVWMDLRVISKQEKFFGFNFNDEMKKEGITEFVHRDAKWLILVIRFRVYVYRKGFLSDFGFRRKSPLGKKMESKIIAACADGKGLMIRGDGATLTAIQEWARK